MEAFIGRQLELKKLNSLSHLNRACLVVINGRRRIGKSRLVQEYAVDKRFLSFTGLAPVDGITAQMQRDHFGRQLSEQLSLPPVTFNDWTDGLNFLIQYINEEPTVVLFDEISWMADDDLTFVPKLKAWWDTKVQQRSNIILVICGSISTWIEKNIINSTAFFGRITLTMRLEELSLAESYALLLSKNVKASFYEIFTVLSLTGGIPWYLEQINPASTINENIKNLCFSRDGLFVNEYYLIFHDLFDSKSEIYKKIINLLAQGVMRLSEIREHLNYHNSGTLTGYLTKLRVAGFINQHSSWNVKAKKAGKIYYYRLKDNYLRFYIKYIQPNLEKINSNKYQEMNVGLLPNWDTIMGFQVENLLLANRSKLIEKIGLNPDDIVFDDSFVQCATKRIKGCQIDYLIQTSSQNIYVCEFKFKRRTIGCEVIEDMKTKLARLSIPKGFGVIPVLFHLSEVTPKVHEENFFYKIIDIGDLLQ